jgi:hypothetical protein
LLLFISSLNLQFTNVLADSANICHADPCSLCWPWIPFTSCNGVPNGYYTNITLRNITINNPSGGAGVIIGSPIRGMENILFDGVIVTNPPNGIWSPDYWSCEGGIIIHYFNYDFSFLCLFLLL